jgi:hypothetical protein
MSMIGNFLLVDETRLLSVLREPELVHELCDEGYEAGADDFTDVDKAWHCLHYLFTGTADGGTAPLDFVYTGGRTVGDEDVGYGPARAFLAAELAAVARALEKLDHDELVARFDGRRMDQLEIYPSPGQWSDVDPSDPEQLGYYLDHFDAVRSLVQRGAREGKGMLVWLS